jgi:hypothetical protein
MLIYIDRFVEIVKRNQKEEHLPVWYAEPGFREASLAGTPWMY